VKVTDGAGAVAQFCRGAAANSCRVKKPTSRLQRRALTGREFRRGPTQLRQLPPRPSVTFTGEAKR